MLWPLVTAGDDRCHVSHVTLCGGAGSCAPWSHVAGEDAELQQALSLQGPVCETGPRTRPVPGRETPARGHRRMVAPAPHTTPLLGAARPASTRLAPSLLLSGRFYLIYRRFSAPACASGRERVCVGGAQPPCPQRGEGELALAASYGGHSASLHVREGRLPGGGVSCSWGTNVQEFHGVMRKGRPGAEWSRVPGWDT